MKIGIVTVHDSSNFGSFLQAYAMKVALTNMGHKVYFIKTRDKKYLKHIFYKYPVSKRSLKHPIEVLKEYFDGKTKEKKFLEDLELVNQLEKWDDVQLDQILLGSDEIWNVTMPVFRREVFYGIGMEKVSAFAVSAGKATIEQMQEYSYIPEAIKALHKIYVRDENTKDIVEQIKGDTPPIVCDPTFLVPVEYFKKEYVDPYLDNNEYILLYSYPIYVSENVKNCILRYAKENHLKIVSACFKYDWCDYYVNCSPLDFCAILKKAQYVVTTTFHGTIFSVLNKKNFACIPFSIKVNDVIQRLGIASVIFDKNGTYSQFKAIYDDNAIDYDKVEEIILSMRAHGLGKLKECLKQE